MNNCPYGLNLATGLIQRPFASQPGDFSSENPNQVKTENETHRDSNQVIAGQALKPLRH